MSSSHVAVAVYVFSVSRWSLATIITAIIIYIHNNTNCTQKTAFIPIEKQTVRLWTEKNQQQHLIFTFARSASRLLLWPRENHVVSSRRFKESNLRLNASESWPILLRRTMCVLVCVWHRMEVMSDSLAQCAWARPSSMLGRASLAHNQQPHTHCDEFFQIGKMHSAHNTIAWCLK